MPTTTNQMSFTASHNLVLEPCVSIGVKRQLRLIRSLAESHTHLYVQACYAYDQTETTLAPEAQRAMYAQEQADLEKAIGLLVREGKKAIEELIRLMQEEIPF